MSSWLRKIASPFKYTIFHPQWLSNHYHLRSRKQLQRIKNSTVLDIGSGDSNHEKILHSSNVLVKLDYPSTNKLYKNQPDIFANSAKLPIKNQTIDIALFLEVMEHIEADFDSLKEINRVLKPEGRLFISVPFIYPIHDQPHDFRRYTIHGLEYLLAQAGFGITDHTIHGNSIVTAFQLLNLSILETCRLFDKKNKLLAAIVAIGLYPLCLLNNVLACTALRITVLRSSCFGYFLIADKTG